MIASEKIQKYFQEIEKEVNKGYEIATSARKLGLDPETYVDIPLAKNMAERVQGLICAVTDKLTGTGMTKRITQLEQEFGSMDWRVGFKIAEEVAKEKFCKFKDKKTAIELGIRVGFAYLTGGIVSAPLEGFIEIKIKKRKDGQEYVAPCYAGPIRGAGGTAAATSVILTDYIRTKMGYASYDPDETEVNRFITEIRDYHERITNLQYLPSEDEIKFMMSHLPVEIDGDPTEKIDVSNYKDLQRVETNKIRGGICLVIAEGLCQKAPKLWKRLSAWGKEFDLNWEWLQDFLSLQKKKKAKTSTNDTKDKLKLAPNYTFIADLVAGRPVLTEPMAKGGFRLRYGRCRTSGFSAASIHPATQIILNKYIATGTQLKVERPGKAAAITPCDSIEGPIVKLKNGNVIKLRSEIEAKTYFKEITNILFLGDILFNYGDFSENGHILVPPGYCEEWWVQEFEKSIVNMFGNIDMEKTTELIGIEGERLRNIIENIKLFPTVDEAIKISATFKIPLHPEYTFYWSVINIEEYNHLIKSLKKAEIKNVTEQKIKLILPFNQDVKNTLEMVGCEHTFVSNEFIVLENDAAKSLLSNLGINTLIELENIQVTEESILVQIQNNSKIIIRDKAGTFIGARMGRPEKAKMRKLKGSPHVLFPIGEEGGRLRSFQSALEEKKITADFPKRFCEKCNKHTIYPVCEDCNSNTKLMYFCKECGEIDKDCGHDTRLTYQKYEIDIKHYFNSALNKLNYKTYPDLIKGVKGTPNKDHIPENLVKGILRAKHEIFVNKDGTTRYDMSELPITHFKPIEIRTSVEKLKEMGYDKDMHGKELVNDEQVLELFPQDVILPACPDSPDESADAVLYKIANFIDDALENIYGQKPFYNLNNKKEIVGSLIIGLAPHISAGMIGRIIGFSETQGCYTHPMWHAALRRDCDGDECCFILLMDALLNFSRQYLPDKRGGRTMDSPLVLTSIINPSEVDDQALGLDVVWKYPLEFYQAALEYKNTNEVKIEQIKHHLGTERQYEKMGFTHSISNINMGVKCSAYKTLPSMQEKLFGQMDLAEKIRAVSSSNVARLVIEKHFLKDTKGNLRKFSQQQFRCTKCNEKYRRPPLIGKCKCGNSLIFTISEGSVVKYLEPSISLAEKYNVPVYVKQTLEILKRRVEGVFGKEKEKQVGLGAWFA